MPKLDPKQFEDLIGRVREGDQTAAADLVRIYEPEIRREIRLRLTDSGMRRTLDSTDICQSIFANFFVRATVGQFEFDRPEALLRLLSQMAKNKLIDRHRRETVRQPKGEARLVYGEIVDDLKSPHENGSPSQDLQAKELLAAVEAKMTEGERRMSRMRREGLPWNEIANQLGESADALRKRLSRAVDRILAELKIE